MTKESPSFEEMEKALYAVRDQQGLEQAKRIVKSFGYERAVHIQARDYGRVIEICSRRIANPQMLIHGLLDEEIEILLAALEQYTQLDHGDTAMLIEKLKYTLGH